LEEFRIRPFRESDAVRLFEIESQPEMVRYQDFEARTLESSLAYVQRAMTAEDSVVEFAIVDGLDTLIGRVGAAIDDEVAWLWYSVDPACQGRGIARRAIRELIERLPGSDLRIECDPRNIPSCRVAEALGFLIESEGTIIVKGVEVPSRVYSQTRSEVLHSRLAKD
jgi:RimJ/RimL family protein N-acetyltransferase